MIVFTKDTQYNQCKREDILNFKNQNYINSLKHELIIIIINVYLAKI